MKGLFQILAVFTLSTGIIAGAFGQEVKSDDPSKNRKTEIEQISLKDQNQNQGDTRNREQNRVIHGPNFIDNNLDGYNDNAPDHDKDGIPNGQDSDYTRAGKGGQTGNFVDIDGDGIADNAGQSTGKGYRKGRNNKGRYGPTDGTDNQVVRPKDGSGFGPGAKSGNCDGSGRKGKNIRGSQRK
jgi:hypothetical protein